MNVKSLEMQKIDTRLKYDPNLDPPFVVVTSMPAL